VIRITGTSTKNSSCFVTAGSKGRPDSPKNQLRCQSARKMLAAATGHVLPTEQG